MVLKLATWLAKAQMLCFLLFLAHFTHECKDFFSFSEQFGIREGLSLWEWDTILTRSDLHHGEALTQRESIPSSMILRYQDKDLGRISLLADYLRLQSWIAVFDALLYTLLDEFFDLSLVHCLLVHRD